VILGVPRIYPWGGCQYVFDLHVEWSQTFLNAYRQVLPLTGEELAVTADAYGWIQAHNLWPYRSYYLKHNQKVRDFIRPRPVAPGISFEKKFENKWAAVQPFLR
jgi:hypothetical protein